MSLQHRRRSRHPPRGEPAIGYRIHTEFCQPPSYGVVLNPPKQAPLTLTDEDRVLVLAERLTSAIDRAVAHGSRRRSIGDVADHRDRHPRLVHTMLTGRAQQHPRERAVTAAADHENARFSRRGDEHLCRMALHGHAPDRQGIVGADDVVDDLVEPRLRFSLEVHIRVVGNVAVGRGLSPSHDHVQVSRRQTRLPSGPAQGVLAGFRSIDADHDDRRRVGRVCTACRVEGLHNAKVSTAADRVKPPSARTTHALNRTDRFIDVGCGSGAAVRRVVSVVGLAVGVDACPAMIERARELAPPVSHTRFVIADVHHLPFGDGAFTALACTAASRHFADLDTAVGEMARVLASDGRVCLVDLFSDPAPRRPSRLRRSQPYARAVAAMLASGLRPARQAVHLTAFGPYFICLARKPPSQDAALSPTAAQT